MHNWVVGDSIHCKKGDTGKEPDLKEEILGLVFGVLDLSCVSVISVEI